MVPSSVKHSNREERERKMQSSENQQVETRARNGTGLEFGSFFHRRGTDHFQLSTAFSWERSLSLGKVNISKCKHTPAATMVFSRAFLCDTTPLALLSLVASNTGAHVPRHASVGSLRAGRKHRPSLFSQRPRAAASSLPPTDGV